MTSPRRNSPNYAGSASNTAQPPQSSSDARSAAYPRGQTPYGAGGPGHASSSGGPAGGEGYRVPTPVYGYTSHQPSPLQQSNVHSGYHQTPWSAAGTGSSSGSGPGSSQQYGWSRYTGPSYGPSSDGGPGPGSVDHRGSQGQSPYGYSQSASGEMARGTESMHSQPHPQMRSQPLPPYRAGSSVHNSGMEPPSTFRSHSGEQRRISGSSDMLTDPRVERHPHGPGIKGMLRIDRDLEQVTARAMKASGKGKERAEEEDGWEFGPPLNVREGMFAGRVLRFAAQCVQQPVYGRRKTEKDRRPLAPVPIIRLRIRECTLEPYDRGWKEQDLDISSMEPSFLVCAAELSRPTDQIPDSLAYPGSTNGPPDMRQHTGLSGGGTGPGGTDGATGPLGPGFPSPVDGRPTLHPGASFAGRVREPLLPMQYVERGTLPGPSSLRHRASWIADGHWDTSSLAHGIQSEPTQAAHRATAHPERLRRRPRDTNATQYEQDEGSDYDMTGAGARTPKRVRAGSGPSSSAGIGFEEHQRNLYGTLHVTAVRVPDLDGVSGLWFLFTDTCVRQEGTYSMRFRVFDLSVVSPQVSPVPDLASCESGTFKVYSPRNFPGLPKPTELSEHFVKQGFKLNTRKNERQVKTPSPSPPPPSGMIT